MVKSLNTVTAKRAIQRSFLVWIVAAAPSVMAEALNDPTRPPASLGVGQETNSQVADSGPVLQSVLVSSGRKVAVISGQAVSLGGKFGDSRLVKITESEVTLLNGKNLQTLKLFPSVEKRMISSRTSPQADSRRQ
jgi:MSHA biogenesis protein MshK